MKRLLTGWLISLAYLGLVGCATPSVLEHLDYSFRLLIVAINQSFPNGSAGQSSNSREWLSHYFIFENGRGVKRAVTDTVPVRSQAQVTILGDRRPYRVEVVVYDERRQGEKFERASQNIQATEWLAKQIDGYLVKSRDNRDLIDDFRAF